MVWPAGSNGCLEETMVLHAMDQAAPEQHNAVTLGFRCVSGSISGRSIEGPVGGHALRRRLGISSSQLRNLALSESATVDAKVVDSPLKTFAVSLVGSHKGRGVVAAIERSANGLVTDAFPVHIKGHLDPVKGDS